MFTAGRLKAQVEQAKAGYRETVAQYEQGVLTAYQQVEDQLAPSAYSPVKQLPRPVPCTMPKEWSRSR